MNFDFFLFSQCFYGQWICPKRSCPKECKVISATHFKTFDKKYYSTETQTNCYYTLIEVSNVFTFLLSSADIFSKLSFTKQLFQEHYQNVKLVRSIINDLLLFAKIISRQRRKDTWSWSREKHVFTVSDQVRFKQSWSATYTCYKKMKFRL